MWPREAQTTRGDERSSESDEESERRDGEAAARSKLFTVTGNTSAQTGSQDRGEKRSQSERRRLTARSHKVKQVKITQREGVLRRLHVFTVNTTQFDSEKHGNKDLIEPIKWPKAEMNTF